MKVKKADFLIIFAMLTLSLIMSLAISNLDTKKEGQIIRIEQGSRLIGEYPLDYDREIDIDVNGHYNKVVIKDGKAFMKEANCRDQICVHMKEINMDGETIICLPNKVFIEVVDKKSKDNDDAIDKVVRWKKI